ncbi:YT521-B-like domain-containing protein [Mycena vulgaris]|nr:YT521-B-like domain-containing protein [Mycena vulgaris]
MSARQNRTYPIYPQLLIQSLVPLPHENPRIRRAYDPNPPGRRSEWAMWTGNIPSEADHDELWRFFTQQRSRSGNTGKSPVCASRVQSGVISIFLITRSKCAFVNYETEWHREEAIARFNGVPLRTDPGCACLVCRVTLKEAHLRTGVGGQRGMIAARDDARSNTATAKHSFAASLPLFSLRSSGEPEANPEHPPPRPHSAASSSVSLASTNSSLFQRYFPQRFFILKSLTRIDLDLSVRRGLWATQKHNEGVLERAFRTAEDVFLIFSVNKSGEFYGYARMVGQVGEGDGARVPWAVRSPGSARTGLPPAAHETSMLHAPRAQLLIPERLVDNSPHPLPTPPSTPPPLRDVHSAPAQLRRQHKPSAAPKYSLDQHTAAKALERRDSIHPSRITSVAEEKEKLREQGERVDSWGQDFKLQWICTASLPFQRTQHIRNPWNRDREIKVSRDGTELEPSIGEALLEEWRLFVAAEAA